MARLRDHWLEALSTCVTAALLALVYGVLAQYAAGPPFSLGQTSALQPTPHLQQAAGPALR